MCKNKKDTTLVPFGKYAGQPLEVLLADKSYCAWMVGQASIREQYPELCNLTCNEHGNDIKTPNHNRMQAEYLTEETMLKLFYLVNPEIFRHNKKYYVQNLNDYFIEKMQIVKNVCECMNRRIFEIKKMAEEVATISKDWNMHGKRSFIIPVSPFKKYTDGRKQEEYVFKNPTSLIINEPRELYRNTIQDFELFYGFFDEFRSYLLGSHFEQINKCKPSFENKYNDVTVEINFHEEMKPKFSTSVEKFFDRALYRHSSRKNETINYPDFLNAEWRYANPSKTSELYYIELKPSIGDDYHTVLNQISHRRNMNKIAFKPKASQKVNYLLIIGAYDGTGVTFEDVKRIFKNEEIDIILELDIWNTTLPTIERNFSISPYEILTLNEIFCLLDSVKQSFINDCSVDKNRMASGF